MHFLRSILFAFIFFGCTSGSFDRARLRIGVDPNWYPKDFGPQTSYVNGFTEDFLLEMARSSGMRFELIRASSDNLFDGMQNGKYDAVLTTLPPYEYHLAKFDFSENFLDLGPVLIVSDSSNKSSLDQLGAELVGILTNDSSEIILAKYPSIIIRHYPSIPELLDALARGDIEAALLDQIPAVNYILDLYAGVLKIASTPLSSRGIHLVGPKGSLDAFNKALSTLRKKKSLTKLQQKWELAF